MKILCLVADSVRDSTAVQRELLFSGLVDAGHQVLQVTSNPPRRSLPYPAVQIGTSLRKLHTRFRLWKRVRHEQPDVIHLWQPQGFFLTQLLRWAAPKAPVITTVTTPPPSQTWPLPPVERWLFPTEELAQEWQAWGIPAERIKVIPPAVPSPETSVTRTQLLTNCKLPSDARLLLCLGPLVAGGGHISAVWAADILHYVHEDVRLLIAGTGPERAKLQTFARNIGADRFTSFLDEAYLPCDLVPHAELVWEPTYRTEITDAVLLAQLAGKPLLATRQPCLEPLVHPHAVRWLPPHNPPLWARHTADLLRDEQQRHSMGQAGQRFVQERFSSQDFIARHIKQYERLLAMPAKTWLAPAA